MYVIQNGTLYTMDQQGVIVADLRIENGKITEIEHSAVKAGYKITKSLIKKTEASMVTIIYGEDSSEEEANELEAMISAKFAGKVDVSVLNGGQPVYSFVISVE